MCLTIQFIVFTLQFTCPPYRILELGYGKDIEEILDILGSRQQSSVAVDDSTSRFSNIRRQNLLLSATLNEKVNHLAKISLEDPFLIGLDDKQVQLKPCHEHIGMEAVESDINDDVGNSGKNLCSSEKEFKLPAQLAQRYVQGTQ